MTWCQRGLKVLRAFCLAPIRGSGPGEYQHDGALTHLSALGVCALGGAVAFCDYWINWSFDRKHFFRHITRGMVFFLTCLHCVLFCVAIAKKTPQILKVINSYHFARSAQNVSLVVPLVIVLSTAGCLFTVRETDGAFVVIAMNDTFTVFVTLVNASWALVKTLELAYFACLLSCLTVSFENLIDEVNALLDKRKRGFLIPIDAIRSISATHKQIVDLSEAVINYFGPHILIDLVLEWWLVVASLFSMLTSPFRAIRLLDPAKSTFSRVFLVLVAHRFSRTGNTVLQTVHSFRNLLCLSDNEKSETEVLALEIFHRPVRVSLVGLIDYNSFLIFRLGIAAITTLVILLQFHE